MKKLMMALVLMPMMAVASLTDGLIAYYPFDGNANDASGSGNHGTTHGVTLTTDRFGNANKAYRFDGNAYIEVPDSDSLHNIAKAVSISAWVNATEGYLGGGVTPGSGYISVACKGYANRQYAMQIDNCDDWIFTLKDSEMIKCGSTSGYSIGVWQHVALIWDGATIKTYVNGILAGEKTFKSVLSKNDEPLYIGMDPGDTGAFGEVSSQTEYLIGALDDLRIYNRALSAAEVKALYDGSTVTPTGKQGLSISYYDAGDLTSLRSFGIESATYEDAVNYFENKTPSLVSNTSGIGECLDFGNTDGTCRFHGKYADYATNYFWVFLKGSIVLAETGLYEFGFDCDDSCVIYIDGQKVVGSSNNYDSGYFCQESASVRLSAGIHVVAIVYGENWSDQGLTVYMKRPSESNKSPIPQSILYDGTTVTPPTYYTVTFNANGGSVSPTSRSVASGAAVGTLPTPTRSGYTFAGWWTAASGGSQVSASTKVYGNKTYYAHWTKGSGYTVTFDARGGSLGSANKTRTVASGSAVGELPTPTHASVEGSENTWDYKFLGWYTAPNQGIQIKSGTIVQSDVTYYACYEITCHGYVPIAIESLSRSNGGRYSIMIDAGGGDGYPKVIDSSPAYAKYELPQCPYTRKGYVFAGWSMSDLCYYVGGDIYSWMCQSRDKATIGRGYRGIYAAGTDVEICGVTALVAHWRKGNSVRLTVKPNSTKYGTASGGGKYGAGAKATLKAKAKKGYAFAGWFKDKSCKTALNPKGYDNRNPTVKYTVPAGDTTVYAKFISKKTAKKSLKFSSATKKLAKTPKKVQSGKSFSLSLGISSATITKVTAKGLPPGIYIDSTTGKISGTPTKAGTYTVTITVKDAAGNKITQKIKIKVYKPAVPDKIVGTYYGYTGSGGGTRKVTVTVAASGKVSVKIGPSATDGSRSYTEKLKRDKNGNYVLKGKYIYYYGHKKKTKLSGGKYRYTVINIDPLASWTNDSLNGSYEIYDPKAKYWYWDESDNWKKKWAKGKVIFGVSFSARKNAAVTNDKAKRVAAKLAGLGTQVLYVDPYSYNGSQFSLTTQDGSGESYERVYVKADKKGKMTLSGTIGGTDVSGTAYFNYGLDTYYYNAGTPYTAEARIVCDKYVINVGYSYIWPDIDHSVPILGGGTAYMRTK